MSLVRLSWKKLAVGGIAPFCDVIANEQTFVSAYSVHAWLADDIAGMFENNYIRYWDEVRDDLKVSHRAGAAKYQ